MLGWPAPGPRRTDLQRRQLPPITAHLAMPLRKLRRALPVLAILLLACALGAAGAGAGSGEIELLVALPFSGNLVPTSSPLTLFNGPRLEGKPTVIVHAETTFPATQTYAFTVPIEKRPGEFRYRATADIPPLAGG